MDALEARIQELELENRQLRGDEGSSAGGTPEGDAEGLKLLEGLPQEHAEEPPEGAELGGLDIWATPPIGPALEVGGGTVSETEADGRPVATETVSEAASEAVSEIETEADGSPSATVSETETEADGGPSATVADGSPTATGTDSGTTITLPEPLPRGDEGGDPAGETAAERVEDGLAAGGPADDPAIDVQNGSSPPTGTRLTIHRAVLGTDVVDREPTGVATRFPRAVHKVYCFTEVSIQAGGGATILVHRWSLDGMPQGQTELRIGGDRWRTFSNRTVVEKPGRWQVELVDEAGAVLETLVFTVE